MSEVSPSILSLNAGEVAKVALGRIDLAKMRMAMEVQSNLLPKVVGPARFRPGTAFKTETYGDKTARLLPFVFNVETAAEVELTDLAMRPLVDGAPVTRSAVSAAVSNGDFATDLTDWTLIDETGATSSWDAGDLVLVGTGFNFAGRRQEVSTASSGAEHALRIVVARGPVSLRVGTAAGLDDLIADTSLRTGSHSLAFTPPGGSFWVDIRSDSDIPRRVGSITLEGAGAVVLPTPWPEASLDDVRAAQSGDVLFCACPGFRQQRIERRSQRSWSVVDYRVPDGPFMLPNVSATTVTPSGTNGSITLTASRPVFKPGHVGALFRLNSSGQSFTGDLAGEAQYVGSVRVSGLNGTGARTVTVVISGTWSGSLKLERSFGSPGAWQTVGAVTTSYSFNDGLDNQIVYYRIGFPPGGYTSGTATVTISATGGAQTGIVEITAVGSVTTANADVLAPIGSTSATTDWSEGAWSDINGWPSAVAFFDGRLWWATRDMIFGSISDAYESYDDTKEGDAGPIQRSIATGGFERINWLLGLQRLLAGTEGQEVSIRSSSFDEPLTPTAFTARNCSTRGGAPIAAVQVDATAVFVQRNRTRVFELSYTVEAQDYGSNDLTRVNPDICEAEVVALAVQRQPDTRVWAVLGDGTCAVLTYERADEVIAWTRMSTPNGAVESVCVTPREGEDRVSFVVRRVIGGVTKRYVETLVPEAECAGGTLSKNLDSHIVYTGGATTTISGLNHLEGEEVAVWADGKALVDGRAPLTVSGGAITLPSAASNAVVGLPYTWRLKTVKLAYGVRQAGSPLLQRKRIDHLGLLATDFGWWGVRYGADFDGTMRPLPKVYRGKSLDAAATLAEWDFDAVPFGGGWDTDSRVCLEGVSPYPATLLGLVIGMTTNERGVSRGSPAGDKG